MLIEDQFGVGDVIDAGEASGVVEAVTLRTTRLRDRTARVWHIPRTARSNGSATSPSSGRCAVLDIPASPTADLDRGAAVILAAAEEVWADEGSHRGVGRPEVLASSISAPTRLIRVIGTTRPGRSCRSAARSAPASRRPRVERRPRRRRRSGAGLARRPPGDPSWRHDHPGAAIHVPSVTTTIRTRPRSPDRARSTATVRPGTRLGAGAVAIGLVIGWSWFRVRLAATPASSTGRRPPVL